MPLYRLPSPVYRVGRHLSLHFSGDIQGDSVPTPDRQRGHGSFSSSLSAKRKSRSPPSAHRRHVRRRLGLLAAAAAGDGGEDAALAGRVSAWHSQCEGKVASCDQSETPPFYCRISAQDSVAGKMWILTVTRRNSLEKFNVPE
ncbi:uncharacterized protein [Penaeus vannamei]|uniref:uncharacterized protein n=1 Tax=Penaeus vannamei TaxID=6689 RepID=UPI00387F63AB